jgi:Na+-driven multidrug efflux pump
MMLNNGMQAEGEPRVAILTMAISAIAKILIYPILIIWHDMGLEG